MADVPKLKVVAAGAEGPPEYTSSSPPKTSPPILSPESRIGAVRRAMEKTADKLNRRTSVSAKEQMSQSQPVLPVATNPKRLFSVSRKGKERSSVDGRALQAIPWAEDQDNDDDVMHPEVTPTESESDEDDKAEEGQPSEEPVMSEEEIEEDFEPMKSGISESPKDKTRQGKSSKTRELDPHESSPKIHSSRSGSMATVKLQRRARLAEKLREIFDINGIEEVIAEMPCWLLRSILLQGYMYLTDSYICFFAHMPSREDQILKSGWMSKRATRTKRWIKHWFTLKNDVLSWYQSSADPYFPHGVVDLRYAISCEPSGDKDIRLRTNQKSIKLSADSVPSRDEWVKAIRKVIFKAQNMGDSVKIAIPYSAIIDVEKSSAMDFSETIEIKVVDNVEQYLVDSYFFAYFHDLPAALEQIRDAVRAYRSVPGSSSTPPVIDTTALRLPTSPAATSPSLPTDRAQSAPVPEQPQKSSSGFRFTSLLRPLQEFPLSRPFQIVEPEPEEYTHISRRNGSSFVPVTSTPSPTRSRSPKPSQPTSADLTPVASQAHHTYPPSTSTSMYGSELTASPTHETNSASTSSWSVGVPSWLRMPSRRLLTSPFSTMSPTRPTVDHSVSMPATTASGHVQEVLSSNLSLSVSKEYGYFSLLETPETTVEPEMIDKFRTSFAFDEKERLLGCFPGYIFRLLPVFGRLFISTNYFSFRSSGPLTSRTTMILPIRDVLSTEPCKAFRFGHHGLVVIVRGHEELFFEFSEESKRSAFSKLLEKQIDEVRHRLADGEQHQTAGERDALILEEFGPRTSVADTVILDEPEAMDKSVPPIMFESTSSTFLTFKPKTSLHFTFLTIGSRGDVQPYIALAKGLIKDGHRCRIATHGEFREWIESHGIEFGYVGGDPAELMRICVENGTFTVAFLKEGVQKFRGWIDDLLKTAWDACQGTDVLVESPSAMGGYHIAEALRIPYFRAFTMTWSRTRAYPHAFAVPEHKMGGNYNYMTYVLFDQVFWRGTAGQINRWRRNTLGLPSTSLDKMEPHKIPFLYNFSPVVVPPPLDWPEWIRITGYWFLDDADVSATKWTPPPDLIEFIDSAHKAKKKVVYIGFGSIVVSDPRTMTRYVVEAIVQSGVYAILSKGWSDRLVKNPGDTAEVSEPLPKQIYPISSIPHDWLFKRIDAACHHGGAGTTGASLRAGIPTIIKPFFGDQFFWADRVEALGIGSAVRKLTVQSLTEALVSATTDVKQIERAKMVGEQIRAEDGVGTAIEAIYRDLDYARSLIKGTPSNRDDDAEHATIRERSDGSGSSPERSQTESAQSSPRGGPSSDWSVISETDDYQYTHP
ncbi:hypothetical protein EIP86_003520 [Pleurotus ostreatoroseus]|nr:hypothetical protein EIP86_003520 [Pleurotus ostreatoroseus]